MRRLSSSFVVLLLALLAASEELFVDRAKDLG
jgi:hypothetical protein